MRGVLGRSVLAREVVLHHVAHDRVRPHRVQVVERQSQPGVDEGVRLAAAADQQLGVGVPEPGLHRVQSAAPRQDVEHHRQDALGVRHPRLGVAGQVAVEYADNAQLAHEVPDDGQVTDGEGLGLDIGEHAVLITRRWGLGQATPVRQMSRNQADNVDRSAGLPREWLALGPETP